jgi:hypothetical protein
MNKFLLAAAAIVLLGGAALAESDVAQVQAVPAVQAQSTPAQSAPAQISYDADAGQPYSLSLKGGNQTAVQLGDASAVNARD